MPTLHLNLGANLGPRRQTILAAVGALEATLKSKARISGFVESAPWGYETENNFVNLAVAIDVEGEEDPIALLDITQEVEGRFNPDPHRRPDGSYADRHLDIDIIALDRLRLDSARLTLPHPRAHLRPWVMEPLKQLSPDTARFILTCSKD